MTMQVSVPCIEAWTAISRTLRRQTEGATAPNAGRTGIHNGSVKWLSSLCESLSESSLNRENLFAGTTLATPAVTALPEVAPMD